MLAPLRCASWRMDDASCVLNFLLYSVSVNDFQSTCSFVSPVCLQQVIRLNFGICRNQLPTSLPKWNPNFSSSFCCWSSWSPWSALPRRSHVQNSRRRIALMQTVLCKCSFSYWELPNLGLNFRQFVLNFLTYWLILSPTPLVTMASALMLIVADMNH